MSARKSSGRRAGNVRVAGGRNRGARAAAAEGLRTWIEIDSKAVRANCAAFRKLIGKNVKIWAVVKSNAYGHGLIDFSKTAVDAGVDGFCVDSLVEGTALRRAGIKLPILVLGYTVPSRYREALRKDISIMISSLESLRSLLRSAATPKFHLKIDTGMHRQGLYLSDMEKAIKIMGSRGSTGSKLGSKLEGAYTHFASANDINDQEYADMQFGTFMEAAELLRRAGFGKIILHAAATGGTLTDRRYHLDAVRIGAGLYGLWPSEKLEAQLAGKVRLWPVLSWRVFISEVKQLAAGDRIGYDLKEKMHNKTMMAVLPIGYWHGFPRVLSCGKGSVLSHGLRSRVLGRVSMDITVVELGSTAKIGDTVTIIGKDGNDEISAVELAQKSGTMHYEFLTRLNPLMRRIMV